MNFRVGAQKSLYFQEIFLFETTINSCARLMNFAILSHDRSIHFARVLLKLGFTNWHGRISRLLVTDWQNSWLVSIQLKILSIYFFFLNSFKKKFFFLAIDRRISQYFFCDWLPNFALFSHDRSTEFTIYFLQTIKNFLDFFSLSLIFFFPSQLANYLRLITKFLNVFQSQATKFAIFFPVTNHQISRIFFPHDWLTYFVRS